MLTKQQINLYHELGYIGVPNVLPDDLVRDLRRVTDEFVDRSRQVKEHDDVFDLEPNHSPQKPMVRRIKGPVGQHEVYDRAFRHDSILDVVGQLIGPNIASNGDKLNMKSPEIGSAVQWHQDWAFYPHTNDDLLAVGVIMDDMMIENGCLQVIPGSHSGRTYDHHFEGQFAGAVTEPDFDDAGAVPIELRAGGISIHHVRTLHASLPDTSPRPRRLLLFQYLAGDAWPLINNDWETFRKSFVRGTPSNVPRLKDVPVRLPLPPAKRGGSIYENQSVLTHSTFSNARTVA